ncbi:MAG TPA: hypothetical protein VGR84_15490 [Candidatus Acidoferrales bacterium]|nr:hypothetical protein [Candidatus Acidoferrales bacterium]
MTEERFLELLNGPLFHPIGTISSIRLGAALRFVLFKTGDAGDAALEEFVSILPKLDKIAQEVMNGSLG